MITEDRGRCPPTGYGAAVPCLDEFVQNLLWSSGWESK